VLTNRTALSLIAPPPPKQHLASTQDLLARLQLLPAYDKYVRLGDAGDASAGPGVPTTGAVDKGKGRELGGDVEMADAQDGDDDDGREKKKKNSYKHLIKGIPGALLSLLSPALWTHGSTGKHSFRKEDYLTTMMLVPPKQRMRIHRFDEKTQEDAFAVSLEGLKGVCCSTSICLVPDSHPVKQVELQQLGGRIRTGPGRPEETGSLSIPFTCVEW